MCKNEENTCNLDCSCDSDVLWAIKGNWQEKCGCFLHLSFLLCQRKITATLNVQYHSKTILFFFTWPHSNLKVGLWESIFISLIHVGGRVCVKHSCIATLIYTLTNLWASPGRGNSATSFVWFLVCKQLLTSGNWQPSPLCHFKGARVGTSDIQLW